MKVYDKVRLDPPPPTPAIYIVTPSLFERAEERELKLESMREREREGMSCPDNRTLLRPEQFNYSIREGQRARTLLGGTCSSRDCVGSCQFGELLIDERDLRAETTTTIASALY